MGNIFNDDFRDFIQCLNNQKVEYILVGGMQSYYMDTEGLLVIWTSG